MTFEYLASPDFAIGYPPSAIRSYTDAHDTARVKGISGLELPSPMATIKNERGVKSVSPND